MTGEMNLDALMKGMEPVLVEGTYVFVTLAGQDIPGGLAWRMLFQEAEGTTLIVLHHEAETHGLAYEFPSRMITLNSHSSLESVGFMARISTALAQEEMGVNPVSAFYHDHLFVPEDRVEDAMAVLRRLAR